jgi:hypothetical protein
MDLWEWLDTDAFINDFGEAHSDYAKMHYDALNSVQIEFWSEQLERQWPVIRELAELALAGDTLNTDVIKTLMPAARISGVYYAIARDVRTSPSPVGEGDQSS